MQFTKFNNIIAESDVVGRYTADANADLVLSNITLNDGYKAPHSITTGSNVNVSGTAELKAGNSITLGPGFIAEEGTTFTASIGEVPSTADRFYYLKDHLGSIKMMVNQNGEVKSYDDYYPFGMTMSGRSSVTIEPKYRFTGKEKSEATGYYLFGARTYNPLIGKWNQMDPLDDLYKEFSPFSYCINNPLLIIDPTGMCNECSMPGYTHPWEVVVTANKPDNSSNADNVENQIQVDLICNEVNNPKETNRNSVNIKNYPIQDPYIAEDYGAKRGNDIHKGVDIVNKKSGEVNGKPVITVVSGKVVKLVTKPDGDPGGVRVRIKGPGGYQYNYFHLQKYSNSHLKKDMIVNAGDIIGNVGSTGYSTGPHLHFEIWDAKGKKLIHILYILNYLIFHIDKIKGF